MCTSRVILAILCAALLQLAGFQDPALHASAGAPTQANVTLSPAVFEGEAEVLVEDHADFALTRYFLHEGARRRELRFTTPPLGLMTGDRIRVRGTPQPDGTLALGGSTGEFTEVLTTAQQQAIGPQSTLVILVNFESNTAQPYSPSQAQAVMTQVNDHYWQNSYNQTTVVGASGSGPADVAGWYTVSYNTTTCNTSTIAALADQAATNAGFDLTKYTRKIYEFPTLASCGFQGLATVGGSQAWINGIFSLQSVGHELGHNLGLYHAKRYDCGTVTLGPTCSTVDYGNPVDLMGNTNTGDFNLFGKERLGWINAGVSPPLTEVVASGTYFIGTYEAVNDEVKGLKVLKSDVAGVKTYYYLEFRQPVGDDTFLSAYSNLKNGVIIATGSSSNGNSNLLLDMTPLTTSWNDHALAVGQTFVDPDTGLSIRTLTVGISGATVDISFAATSPTPPSATVSLNTATPLTSAVLTAAASASDANGDAVTLTYVWKVNGVAKKTTSATASLTDTFDLNVAGQGDAGDLIVVEVTPNDGTLTGAMASANATVQAAAPHNVSFATTGLGSMSVTVSYSGTSINGALFSGSSMLVSPGPGPATAAMPGSSFNYSFPSVIAAGGTTYYLQSSTPSSGFSTGAGGDSTTVVGKYAANAAPSATVMLSTAAPLTNAVLTATASKADADGNAVTLTYTWRVNGVTRQTTSSSSSLTDTFDLGATGNGDVGQTVVVEVTPNDGLVSGASVSAAAVVQNTAPVLAAIGSRVVAENALLSFTLSASDADGGPLTYSANNLPPGAAFDAAARVFAWTPTFAQAGTYDVTFSVTDGSYSASELVRITVTNTNRAPVLDPIGSKSIAPGALLAFTISATDADGDAVTYAATSLPAGATFDAVTRTFSWTPGADQVSRFQVTFVASDGVATDGEVVQITVSKPKGRR